MTLNLISNKIKAAQKKQILARLRQRRLDRASLKKKRGATLAALCLGVLLLLFVRCSCDVPNFNTIFAPTPSPSQSPTVAVTPTPGKAARKVSGTHPPTGPGSYRRPRPNFKPGLDAQEPWFDEFRTQVAARSRIAAACFPGQARGAVRWSTDLRGEDGVVSRSVFESVGELQELTPAQTDCLEQALASRPYLVSEFKRDSARVSVIVSF